MARSGNIFDQVRGNAFNERLCGACISVDQALWASSLLLMVPSDTASYVYMFIDNIHSRLSPKVRRTNVCRKATAYISSGAGH